MMKNKEIQIRKSEVSGEPVELTMHQEFASIIELKDAREDNEDSIRVYCTQMTGNGKSAFNFQIRTHKGINNSYGNVGVPRNMIATVGLTIKQMEDILAFMKSAEAHTNKIIASN